METNNCRQKLLSGANMPNLVTIDLDSLRADIAAARAEHAASGLRVTTLEALELAVIDYGKRNGKPSSNGHAAAVDSHLPVVTTEEIAHKTVHDAAFVVLTKAARPMKTKEIVAVFQAANFGQNIKNLHSAAFTALDRKDKMFKKVAASTWALAGIPIEDEWPEPQEGE
jgi:HB1, ASXL, restriction endonuclease HTH domain